MSNLPKKINPVVLSCVVCLCVAAVCLIFLLPAESLVIDLIYQGF
jgi:hypothetical protein